MYIYQNEHWFLRAYSVKELHFLGHFLNKSDFQNAFSFQICKLEKKFILLLKETTIVIHTRLKYWYVYLHQLTPSVST